MLLAVLLMASAPASVTVEGADPVLKQRLEALLLPLWRRTLDPERTAQRVKAVYLRSGRFLSTVRHEVRGERLRLIVEPGQQARIISVRFLGNKVLSDEALGQAMFNRVDSAGARLQGLGRFVPEALSDDVTGLKQAYYAKGYISAQIQPPQVFVEPDLGGVRLEVRIQEGEPYTLTTLQVKGLPKGVSFDYKAGQIFSVQGIHKAVEKVRLRYLRQGHALVQVQENSQMNPTKNGVDLWLTFVPGPVCFIESISWKGVQRVDKAVLTRLMRIHAGDAYDHALLQEEINRLRARGLIMGAQIVTQPGRAKDRVKVSLMAQDAPQKWYPAFTVTYLPGEGAVLLLQLSSPNLLGKGIRFRGSSWLSEQRRLFDLSVALPAVLNPLDDLTVEVHNRDQTKPRAAAKTQGGSLTYGRSIDRKRRFSVFASVGADRVTLTCNAAAELGDDCPADPFYAVSGALGGSYDDRDSGLLGTRGQRVSLRLDLEPMTQASGLSLSAQRLQPLPFGFRARAKLGARQLFEQPMPHKVLYAGGPGTLRGFYAYAVSPNQSAPFPNLPTGGDRMIHAALELGYGLNSVFEPFVFLDAGNSFAGRWFEQPSSLRPLTMGLASSWGFGVLLRLPVLPFRFEWGRAISRGPNDPEMLFSLGVGTN